MSEREEAMFQDLVRRAAPAQRDPMFRVKLLERRETEQFRRRTAAFVVLALTALTFAVLAALLRLPVEAVGVTAGLAVSALCFIYAPALLRRVSFFRLSR